MPSSTPHPAMPSISASPALPPHSFQSGHRGSLSFECSKGTLIPRSSPCLFHVPGSPFPRCPHGLSPLFVQVLLKCHIFPNLSDNFSVPSPPLSFFLDLSPPLIYLCNVYILPCYKLCKKRNSVFHIDEVKHKKGWINTCSKNKWTSQGQPE